MPVRCRRADRGHSGCVGKGESGRALFGDQPERRLQQRLLQIAVMIAALGAALFLAPAHVNGFYMSREQSGRAVARVERKPRPGTTTLAVPRVRCAPLGYRVEFLAISMRQTGGKVVATDP